MIKMNMLRPSILHPSPILRRNLLSTSVGNNLNESNVNAANFAWTYWRRASGNGTACWNQLRPHHVCTAKLQDDYTNNNHGVKGGFSHKAFPSPALLSSLPNNMLYASSTSFASALLESTHTKSSVRYVSSNIPKSKVEFSTMGAMPHSTSASSKEGDKPKDKEGKLDFDSLPVSQKAKVLFKKYGKVFVGTYFGIYFTTLFTFFVTLDFGLLDPEVLSQIFKVSKNMACETADVIGPTGTGASMNEAANAYAKEVNTDIATDKRTLVDVITGYLQSWEWTKTYADKLSDNPHLANLGVAWFIVKFTEPIRLAAAVIVTPKVAHILGAKEAKTDETEKRGV